MAVDMKIDSMLFQSLKLDDPIWLPPKTWESIPSESGRAHASASTSNSSSSGQQCLYDPSTVSEASLVRLVMNAMYGVQSALVSIEKLSAAFCSDPADRTVHRISSLWNRSLSTHALGKLLKSMGCSGCVVFLLREFVDYFKNVMHGNASENRVNYKAARNQNHCDSKVGEAKCPSYSLVSQAFAVAVGKVLEGYICALDTLYTSVGVRYSSKNVDAPSCSSSGLGSLTSIVHSEVTLLEVYLHTKELRTQIQAIGNICNIYHLAFCFPESSVEDLIGKANIEFHNFPRAGDLLTYLYTQLQVADPAHRALLKFLFLRSCEPYCGFIRSWIYKAEINDPHKEFIVEYANNLPHYSYGKAGISFDFPVATVREQCGVALPCFLKELLVPLLRAGQQLQVLMKLLELCNYVASGDNTYENILPCWSSFSSNHPSSASPLTFIKENIEDTVLARNNYFKRMWQKLENSLAKLEFRYQQVVPPGPTRPVVGDNNRTLSIPVSFTMSDSLIFPPAHDADSNVAVDDVDSEASYTTDEFSFVVDPSESSECSSPISCEGLNEPGHPTKLAHGLVGPEEKYFSALHFSPSSTIDKSLQKPSQSEKSHPVDGNLREFCEGRDPVVHFVNCHYKGTILSHVSMPLESAKPNWSRMAKAQYADCQPIMSWPLGSILKNPFHVDKGFGGNTMLRPSECSLNESNRDMGVLKESESFFSKITADDDSPKLVKTYRDETENGTLDSFILQLQKLKFHCNFLSMNPMLMKNAFFHLPSVPAEICYTGHREIFSCFDFSSVQNPCKAYQERLAANRRHFFGEDLPFSAVANVCATGNVNDYPDKKGSGGDVPSADSDNQNSAEVILPHVSEGTSWESSPASSHSTVNHSVGEHRQNLVAMFDIPVDFIIEKCLLQEILLQYKCVSKLTIKLLEEGFDLQEHLLALRRYHFMELADWADLFIMSLWHHKWQVINADEKLSKIQGFLEFSVQRSSCGSDCNKERLYIYKKGQSMMPLSISAIGIHSFDFIGLGYRVDWPISIVLTPDALKIYAGIFSFLIQVKLALFSLTDVWCSLKELMHLISQHRHSDLSEKLPHFNILMKMRHQLNHFVSTLQQYVHSQLSHVSWCSFLYSLKHKVKDMMDLESVHTTYLTEALDICFLSDEMQSIARIIESILQCALDFRACLIGAFWKDAMNQGDLLGNLSQINIAQVLAVRETFNKNLRELHLCYLKSPKHGEFGLSRFWGYLNYNEFYSGGIGNGMDHHAFSF
ncbi:uncharacterized protein LOC131149621 [Malania oleifera]|uniref:uncharacterized protein LOC131149621 n=1 Tax=Malania oleifera TaxID=397392 RepID=UPI0025AEC90E|nr:uncharacterized protein LOC131149621 [Malania oleifera]